MVGDRVGLRFLVLAILAVTLGACGASHPNGLTDVDVPTSLGVQADPAAFSTVAGGPRSVGPIAAGRHGTCPEWYHQAFVPPGRAGEAATGEGLRVTYPEVMVITWRCPSVADARTGFPDVVRFPQQTVGGVADQAVILDRTDDAADGYLDSRVFIVGWRQGDDLGAVELAGPDNDDHITAGLAEELAGRAANAR